MRIILYYGLCIDIIIFEVSDGAAVKWHLSRNKYSNVVDFGVVCRRNLWNSSNFITLTVHYIT